MSLRKASEIPDGALVAVWFSCGAASAVAAKKTIETLGDRCQVRVLNNPIANEHPDNLRFLCDVQEWIGVEIESVTHPDWPDCDAEKVWEHKKFMASPKGAPCTSILKREARHIWETKNRPDWTVMGYTADWRDAQRAVNFTKAERECSWFPLVETMTTKQNCFQILFAAGIKRPMIYDLGFPNANCIGCVKAKGKGYWATVRQHFPETFEKRCEQSRRYGARLVELKGERVFLDELPEDVQPLPEDENIECSSFCEERLF